MDDSGPQFMMIVGMFVSLLIYGVYLILVCLWHKLKWFIQSIESKPGDYCTFVPDFDIGYICKIHDEAYTEGGSPENRKRIDKAFRLRIQEHGKKRGKILRYWLLSWIYYLGSRMFGQWRFNQTVTSPKMTFGRWCNIYGVVLLQILVFVGAIVGSVIMLQNYAG